MKLVVTTTIIDQFIAKYGDTETIGAYAINHLPLFYRIPKMYILLLTSKELIVIRLKSLKIEEKEVEKIPLKAIQQLKIKKQLLGGKIKLQSTNGEQKFVIQTTVLGISPYQKQFLEKIGAFVR